MSTPEQTPSEDFVYNLVLLPFSGNSKKGILFAARPSGLYRSEDQGQTWNLATQSISLDASFTATSVAVPPGEEDSQVIFAGMAGGILRSNDQGQTWSLADLPSPPPVISTILFSPNYIKDGTILAGTMEDGVLRSTDHGFRWVAWNFGLLDLTIFCMAISPNFAEDETIFAGAETGIFRSTNGGRAWREIQLPIGFEPVLCLAISPGYSTDGTIIAGTESQGLLISKDWGGKWERIASEVFTGAINSILLSAQYPTSPEILVLSEGKLWISKDSGNSWEPFHEDEIADQEVTTIYAPQGLGPNNVLWLGLYGGETKTLII